MTQVDSSVTFPFTSVQDNVKDGYLGIYFLLWVLSCFNFLCGASISIHLCVESAQ